jgi:aspartyl-tRNA(Asn)/glutamyl-tRNA(Gln) amidotransferase subunit A
LANRAGSLWELTLGEVGELIRRREVSPVEVTRAALERIEQTESHVLAWARLCAARALEDAKRMEELLASGTYLGPLHGIPVGLKDIVHSAGLETSAGSKILSGFVPAEDAVVVRRLRAAGAVILGKTATTQFALFDPAPTRNPHDLAHTPGGSSSGSAAAVAAHQCFAAIGTQTLGSILRPAAYCGIAGLKPTYDVVSRKGVIPLAWSMDHIGPMARTAGDLLLVLDAIREPRKKLAAPKGSPSQYVVGVPDRFFFEKTDPEMLAAFRTGVKRLESSGARIRYVRLPSLFEAGVDAGYVVMRVEIAAFHQQWYFSRPDDYGPKLRSLIESGLRIPSVSYVRAQQVRRVAAGEMRDLWREIDVLATPATLGAAPRGLTWTGDPILNAPFTIFGMPSLAVPAGWTPANLPLGLQLAADYFHEGRLLELGRTLDAGTGRQPPIVFPARESQTAGHV